MLANDRCLGKTIIGCLMKDNSSINEIKEFTKPEHFSNYGDRKLYKEIMRLINCGELVDLSTIEHHLKGLETNINNPVAYLGEIMKSVPSAANAKEYARLLYEQYTKNEYKTLLKRALTDDPVAIEQLKDYDLIKSGKPTVFKYYQGFHGWNSELSYLIKGMIPEQSFGLIYGASGSFKSFLAVSLSCHLATGMDWDSNKCQQGAVLYVIGEGGAGVPKRVKAWSDRYYSGKNVDNLFQIKQPVFIAEDNQWKSLISTVEEIKMKTRKEIKLIVLDTLARCYGGRDENKASDMGAFIRGCDMVKEATGATILAVHHSGKEESKAARGSSALEAAADFVFRVNRPDKGREINLTNTKQKDDEEYPNRAYGLVNAVIGKDSDNENINSLCVDHIGYESTKGNYKPSGSEQVILDIVTKQGGEVSVNFLTEKYQSNVWVDEQNMSADDKKKQKAKIRKQRSRAVGNLCDKDLLISDGKNIKLIDKA